MDTVELYTDGSCWPNPGHGGWAACIVDQNKLLFTVSGKEKKTTNNRMEMLAIIHGLASIEIPTKIIVYTDSMYCILVSKSKCVKQKHKNKDLVQQLIDLNKYHDVRYWHIKGHSGIYFNELADRIALDERLRCTKDL